MAKLTCRNSYRQDTTLISSSSVKCNENGEWEPEPIRCIPGPPIINIYVNEISVSIETDIQENNSTLIEVLEDKIIIYRNREKEMKPNF